MSLPQGPCPVCDKDFKDGDDIVICPSCGAPYHRACYQQEGQCVFTDRHDSGFEYKSPKAPSQEAPPHSATADAPGTAGDAQSKGTLCPQCGTINDASNIFCTRCGTPLHTTAASPPPGGFGAAPLFGGAGAAYAPPLDLSGELDGIPKKDWARFIGSSAPIYLPRMAQMQARKGKISLMLSVFFVSPCYFAYRKMWGWAALALACLLVLQVPTLLLLLAEGGMALPLSLEVLDGLSLIAPYIQLVMQVVFALFALFLYQKHAGKKIRQLRQTHPEEDAYQAALAKKGGVSIIGVVVVIAIVIAASYTFSAVFLDELTVALASTLGY